LELFLLATAILFYGSTLVMLFFFGPVEKSKRKVQTKAGPPVIINFITLSAEENPGASLDRMRRFSLAQLSI